MISGYDKQDTFYGIANNALKKDELEINDMLAIEKESKRRQMYEESFRKVSHLQKLKSDYLDATAHYYNNSTNEIISLGLNGELSKPSYEKSKHLRELNNIPGGDQVPCMPWEGVDHSKMPNFNTNTDYEKNYNSIVNNHGGVL